MAEDEVLGKSSVPSRKTRRFDQQRGHHQCRESAWQILLTPPCMFAHVSSPTHAFRTLWSCALMPAYQAVRLCAIAEYDRRCFQRIPLSGRDLVQEDAPDMLDHDRLGWHYTVFATLILTSSFLAGSSKKNETSNSYDNFCRNVAPTRSGKSQFDPTV
jgi:hypothetical protein